VNKMYIICDSDVVEIGRGIRVNVNVKA
jgi:hypothetical protein